MAVAYTQKIAAPKETGLDRTFAALQFKQQQAAAAQKAALAQKKARQKEAGERLAKIAGFDITQIPIGIRPAVMNMWDDLNAKAPELLESDDPTMLARATQSFLNQFNMAADQLKDEGLQEGMNLFESVSTNDQALATYNDNLPPFYRAEENLSEEFNARENRLHGIGMDWSFRTKEDGSYELVFNQEVDGGGVEQLTLENWSDYHNSELADIPQTANYRKEPSLVGVENIMAGMQNSDFPWTEAVARSRATDIIFGNSEDGKDMRAFTAFKYFTPDMIKNPEVMAPFAAGNMRDPIFFDATTNKNTVMGDQVEGFMAKTIDAMVEASKYATEPEEPEKPTAGALEMEAYLGRMRREKTPVKGMVVEISDPQATNAPANQRFAGRVLGLRGDVEMYTLGDAMNITNFRNPIFGMVDAKYEQPLEGSEKQMITLNNVVKFGVIPPQQDYPRGGMILRDVSVDNVSIPIVGLDYRDASHATVIDQIMTELRKKTGKNDLEFSDLQKGWGLVKVKDASTSPTGGIPR